MIIITSEQETLRFLLIENIAQIFCTRQPFFFFWFIKEDAVAKFHIMETYTSQADNLYQEVNKIKYRDYLLPYMSCYKNLLEFEEIIVKTREIESPARDICKKF